MSSLAKCGCFWGGAWQALSSEELWKPVWGRRDKSGLRKQRVKLGARSGSELIECDEPSKDPTVYTVNLTPTINSWSLIPYFLRYKHTHPTLKQLLETDLYYIQKTQ